MITDLKAAYPTWVFRPSVMRTARVTGWSGTMTAHIDHHHDYTAHVEQAAHGDQPARVVYGHGATAPAALADALRRMA